MCPTQTYYPDSEPTSCVLSREATNTHLRVFCEPTIYRTQGEHANHYTTDMVYIHFIMNDMCRVCIFNTGQSLVIILDLNKYQNKFKVGIL